MRAKKATRLEDLVATYTTVARWHHKARAHAECKSNWSTMTAKKWADAVARTTADAVARDAYYEMR